MIIGCVYSPTPGYGGMPGYAACGRAASPFGRPCGGIVKCKASELETCNSKTGRKS